MKKGVLAMKRATLVGFLVTASLAIGTPALAQDSKPGAHPDKAAQPEKEQPKDNNKDKDNKKKHDTAQAEPGMNAPDFTGTDTDGKTVSLSALLKEGKIVVLQWFNPDCPFVRKHYEKAKTFNDLYAKYSPKGVAFLAINSNAKGEQGSGKERNAKAKKEWNIPYPIIVDDTSTIGHAYGAQRTPQMIIIGKDGKIAYNGAIDDDSGDGIGKTNYVAKALDELLAGTNVSTPKTRPYGCTVKYSK
jgi:peroxiredoxin